MLNFFILNFFKINIYPPKSKILNEIFWSPPPLSWSKCNSNGTAKGIHPHSICAEVFIDDRFDHVGSFAYYVGNDKVLFAELTRVMVAIE